MVSTIITYLKIQTLLGTQTHFNCAFYQSLGIDRRNMHFTSENPIVLFTYKYVFIAFSRQFKMKRILHFNLK